VSGSFLTIGCYDGAVSLPGSMISPFRRLSTLSTEARAA
jgi:hypothetical protein